MSAKLEILYTIRRHLIGLLRAVEQLVTVPCLSGKAFRAYAQSLQPQAQNIKSRV